MYPVSSAYLAAIQADSVTQNWYGRVVAQSGLVYTIQPSVIAQGSGKVTRQISSGDNFEIGTTCAAELDISLYLDGVSRYELFNGTVTLYFQLWVNGRWESIPVGLFNITEPPERSVDVISIHAYDNMVKFNRPFGATLSGTPYTLLRLACEQCGVLLGTSLKEIESYPNGTTETRNGTMVQTWRDLIGYLAGYLCCYALIGADGKLYLKPYTMSVVRTISANWRFSYKPRDWEARYTSLTAHYDAGQTNDEVLLSTAGLNYDFGTNPFVQFADTIKRYQALNAIMERLTQVRYTPFEATVPCDPSIWPGDVINFVDNHAVDGKLAAVTEQVMRINGAMELSCKGADPLLKVNATAGDNAIAALQERLDSVTGAINALIYDYNTEPIDVEQDERTLGMLNFYISQCADVEGHLLVSYTASEPTRLIVRFYDQDVEELFSPVEIDIHDGAGTLDIPHAYLNRQVGVHAVYATAQVYSGTLSIDTRDVLFTIDAGSYAQTVDNIPMDVRDISVRQLLESNGPDQVWVVGIEDGEALVSRRDYRDEYVSAPEWVGVENLGEAIDAAIEFDGAWVLRAESETYTLKTDDMPWYFWITPNHALLGQHGGNLNSLGELATNVLSVHACKGYSSNLYPEQDQGLIVAYITLDGRACYRQYVYSVETGTKQWLPECVLEESETWDDVRVHRLNDYRVAFTLSNANHNVWLISERTYVNQAAPPEHRGDCLSDRWCGISVVPPDHVYRGVERPAEHGSETRFSVDYDGIVSLYDGDSGMLSSVTVYGAKKDVGYTIKCEADELTNERSTLVIDFEEPLSGEVAITIAPWRHAIEGNGVRYMFTDSVTYYWIVANTITADDQAEARVDTIRAARATIAVKPINAITSAQKDEREDEISAVGVSIAVKPVNEVVAPAQTERREDVIAGVALSVVVNQTGDKPI